MQPLNPFLSALSKSPILSQCQPPQQHILLVPTADVLLNARDPDSGAPLLASIASDEFLASHVVRIPIPRAQGAGAKDGSAAAAQNLREMRGKPKIYGTLNGRSLVIKENSIYTNKGMLGIPLDDLVGYMPETNMLTCCALDRLQTSRPGQHPPRRHLVPRHPRSPIVPNLLHYAPSCRIMGGGQGGPSLATTSARRRRRHPPAKAAPDQRPRKARLLGQEEGHQVLP
jgi:hypothetical protein